MNSSEPRGEKKTVVAYAQLQVDVPINEEADPLDLMDNRSISQHLPIHVVVLVLALNLPLVLDYKWQSNILVHQSAFLNH